ncbi:Glycosyl transferase family 2 [Pseudonocardia thermophila]|uniref:Glycosyl transferase family 2 n=1 Tax=Pseudonocardia thermophila TaxID=1848 RepID=A0A1M6YUV1_PSETH|nr:glycosyltransferase family A protein [Pseudonocardia thermophila]SHL21987.1 Glycosyl transferase family 2 [Pseudonocardia thermophila]
MNHAPRLTVGLPVFNGEDYLAEALESLLAQTFTDFELIISDNASTDGTEQICRRYAARDPRVHYVRQPRNLGISANHNVLVALARGTLFKWAGHDDLFDPDLLRRCVQLLDEHPDAVLATAWTAVIDENGEVTDVVDQYPADSDSPRAAARYRGLLRAISGDDDYGVIRTAALRSTGLLGSYYHADRALVLELSLIGRFLRIPEPLYFRRDRADRVSRPSSTRRNQAIRDWCVRHDPARAGQPVARLLGEYVLAFFTGIARAPIPAADKRACCAELVRYLGARALRLPSAHDEVRDGAVVVRPAPADGAA